MNTTIGTDTPRNALRPGHQLLWYRIRRVLGVGGFGITYLAIDENLDVKVAIKEYLPGDLSSREADASVQPMSGSCADAYQWGLERFMIEARTLARFKHPNIVEVRSVFEANHTAYMVMTYETGDSLAEIITQRGPLDEGELKAIALPILDGLSQVHAAGFIHRDIKPSNIYVRRDGQPVLLDFGAARQAVGERTRTLTSVLSPGYAPFEQYFSNADKQGPWTDIYAMGATLYHGVTGKPPLAAVDRSADVLAGSAEKLQKASAMGAQRYSPAFLAAIDHALAFRPEDRPQKIATWRDELCAPSEPTVELAPVAGGRREPRLSDGDLPQIRIEDDRRSHSTVRPPARSALRSRAAIYGVVAFVALAAIAAGIYLFEKSPTATAEQPTRAPSADTVIDTKPPGSAVATNAPPLPDLAVADNEAAAASVEPKTDSALETQSAQVARLMNDAEAANAAGRLGRTAGDSAAEAYSAVLEIDPANEAARQGLERIERGLTDSARDAIQAGELQRAAASIDSLRALDPDSIVLPELQAGLESLQAQRSRDAEVYQLLASAKTDLEEGRIIEPEGDNALEKYRQVESLRPGMGAVKKGFIDIGNYLLERADEASAQEQFDEAYAYLDTAKSILPEREEIDSAREYVDNRRLTYEMKQRRDTPTR